MTAGCAQCREYAAQIAELESTLEGAIYLTGDTVTRLQGELRISRQQAEAVELLWRARGHWLTWQQIDGGLSSRYEKSGPRPRVDDEFRSDNVVRMVVSHVRRRVSRDFIESRMWVGYRLSKTALQRVDAILKDQP